MNTFFQWINYAKRHIQLPLIAKQTSLIQFPESTISSQLPSGKYLFVKTIDTIVSIHPTYYAVAFIFVCVFLFMYIKIKYPFWNGQPVYHVYDFWRKWGSSSPYILHSIPIKTKYYDKQQVVTTSKYADLEHTIVTELVDHLQYFYIPSDRIIYNLEVSDYRAHFGGQSEPSFVSIYNEIVYMSGGKSEILLTTNPKWTELVNSETTKKNIIGTLSSRYVQLYLLNESKTMIQWPAYYQDFLCIHRQQSKIVRTLFDTHAYNIRVSNPSVKVSILKYETELLDGVVPLVSFASKTFFLRTPAPPSIQGNYALIQIQKTSVDILHDFWSGFLADPTVPTQMFDCMMLPEIGNILSLIQSRNMWIYCLKRQDYVYAIYVLRNAHTNYEDLDDIKGNGGNTLYLVGSICNTDNIELFFHGYLLTLRAILKIHPHYKMIMMDCIGHNHTLLTQWELKHECVFQTQSAYYVYNMIVPNSPINSQRCFIVV
jgi:hypothetical protein